ncbi:MAG: sensor histidine kinase [Sedimentisphaerales bacterium]|nr:sensor histidine kinase [Sedimentisphaerales bacterium]
MDALKYGMAELGRNVVQHSNSPVGGVAIAQFFPDRNSLQISISDCGQGILSSLNTTYPELCNDLEGLKLAILPHVSGAFRHGMYSASENAGLGLFFTKEICWRAGGTFWLASKRALLGVTENEAVGMERVYRRINTWDGTSVTMDLPATGVVDFGGLLSLCRTLAAEAQKCSGPAALDFLTEVPELKGLKIISVGDFNEDVEAAATVRNNEITPTVKNGNMVVLDFKGSRFATQSFIHALLNDVFRLPASILRLSFVNCTRPTEEAIRAVAAYAASYRQCV